MSIRYETIGKVGVLNFDRPERLNALDPEAMRRFRELLIEFRDSSSTLALIVTGSGEQSFCVGTDVTKTLPPPTSFASSLFGGGAEAADPGNYLRDIDIASLEIQKPIIAAVNGYAVGGGLEIALNCDIRYASRTASFGLPEVQIGSVPAAGGIQRLIRSVGMSDAMKLLLTGDRIDATEALRIGLISAIFEPEELLPQSLKLAERICNNGPLAVRAVKMIVEHSQNLPLSEGVALERLIWGVLRDTADRIEGRKAFAEKRKPVFRGC